MPARTLPFRPPPRPRREPTAIDDARTIRRKLPVLVRCRPEVVRTLRELIDTLVREPAS